jgi:hypothetical protein
MFSDAASSKILFINIDFMVTHDYLIIYLQYRNDEEIQKIDFVGWNIQIND